MIHPSYSELFEVINGNDEDGEKIISSRYSICVANAKRARQLIKGATPLVEVKCNKPLSIAVEEIYQGKVQVLSADALATKHAEQEATAGVSEEIPEVQEDSAAESTEESAEEENTEA
ncbi:DNA-directed RNA polymerase subunit omega [Eubacterium sp.]|uniref:DNA-directed RNA polymerase subunit omega n=1 Tax=Eubacterium sp. TaxID=142586 RepID=UPI00258C7AB5|nr:DNA-directed RNA polymerase subunit omega [Eubacterium sp.]MCR5369044.1 DNA-directed RNA polymerase subunit omega [Eubacterium sp.]